MKMIVSIILTLASLYFFSCLALYFFQEKLIFFPQTPINEVYQQVSQNEISVTLNNQQIRGWKIDVDNDSDKILFYFGGNAEDVVYLNFEAKKFNVGQCITFNYAGYGASEGLPSEKILYEHALKLYDSSLIKYNLKPENIIIVGRSLGSSVATYLAAHREAAGLILITPFDSMKKLSQNKFKIFPINIILKHSFSTIEYIEQVKAKILLLSAMNDEIIPIGNLQNLKNVIASKATIIGYNDVSHNTIQVHNNYYSDINEFISMLP